MEESNKKRKPVMIMITRTILIALLCAMSACTQQQVHSASSDTGTQESDLGHQPQPEIERWDIMGLAFLGEKETSKEYIRIGGLNRFGYIEYNPEKRFWYHDLGSQKQLGTYRDRARVTAQRFFQDMPQTRNSKYTFGAIAVFYRLIVLSYQRTSDTSKVAGLNAGELFYDSKTDKIVAWTAHPANIYQPSQNSEANPPATPDQVNEHGSVEERWDLLGLAFPSNVDTAGEYIQVGGVKGSKFGKIVYDPQTGAWFQYVDKDKYENLPFYKQRALAAAHHFLPDEPDDGSRHEFTVNAIHYRLIVITYRTIPKPGYIMFGGRGSLYYDAITDKIVAWTANGG